MSDSDEIKEELDEDEVIQSVHLAKLSSSSNMSTTSTHKPIKKLPLKVDYQASYV